MRIASNENCQRVLVLALRLVYLCCPITDKHTADRMLYLDQHIIGAVRTAGTRLVAVALGEASGRLVLEV